MTYSIVPDDEALRKCAWCGEHINDGMEISALGVVLREGVDLSAYANHCIEITAEEDGQALLMAVTAEGSQAAGEGYDGLFMVCSGGCRKHLQERLEKEIASGRLFASVAAIPA